jgi:hypothetical protein
MGSDAARCDHPFGQPLRLVLEHLLRFGGVATPLRPQQWFLVLRGRPTTDLRAFSDRKVSNALCGRNVASKRAIVDDHAD